MRDLLRRAMVLAAVAALLLPQSAAANLRGYGMMQPVELGSSTLHWFGLAIYRARLFTEGRNRFDWQLPLALEIEYFRNITREDLTQSTRSEIERMEGRKQDLDALIGKLDSCFRSVGNGDVFTAVSLRPDQLAIYLNGARTCALRHTGIRKRFLGIWLSDNSRSTRLTSQLRGD